jgi:hypothetical protein
LLPDLRERRAQQVLVVIDAWWRHIVGNLRLNCWRTASDDEQRTQMDSHAVSHPHEPVIIRPHLASMRSHEPAGTPQ